MKKFFAIVLLAGVFAMNADMICKSLCMTGYGTMAHASHHMAKHEVPKGELCPLTHKDAHHPHHDMPQTSIKCNCSVDQAASIGFELTIADVFTNLKPHSHIISKIHSHEKTFLSNEPIPFEGPPKLIS